MAVLFFLPVVGLSTPRNAALGRMPAFMTVLGERGLGLLPFLFLKKSRPDVKWLATR